MSFIEHEFDDSSWIKEFRYFVRLEQLIVTMHTGAVYAYKHVPIEEVQCWQDAPSAGAYFNRNIKTYYKRFTIPEHPNAPSAKQTLDVARKGMDNYGKSNWAYDSKTDTVYSVVDNVLFMEDFSHIPRRSAFDVLNQLTDRWMENRRKHFNRRT